MKEKIYKFFLALMVSLSLGSDPAVQNEIVKMLEILSETDDDQVQELDDEEKESLLTILPHKHIIKATKESQTRRRDKLGKKGEATRQHIRSSAFELFVEYGYSKVTMQDICTKCGLSKGGLYRHYEDKSQLFIDILKMLQKEEADREKICIKQELSAAQIMDGYLEHLRQELCSNVPNINIALYEFCVEHKDGVGPELLSEQYQRGLEILLSLIEYGILKDEFHLTNPQGTASAILFLIEGVRMTNEVMPISDNTMTDIVLKIKEMVGITNEI